MAATNKANKQAPIVSIEPIIKPVLTKISIDDIGIIADHASEMLTNVRESMLAPHPRKHSPVYTASQLAALCQIDKSRVTYLLSRGELPQGQVPANGKSRIFTLAEARTWIKQCAPIVKRPHGKKGKVIAVGNFKGGVSKTTTAMTLAQGLSLLGHRVLVVDLDPQASLTTLFGILADSEILDEHTVLPLIYGDKSDLSYAIRDTYWDGVDLIPAASMLFSAEFFLPFKQSSNKDFKFWDVLNAGLEKHRDEYDVIIIDTPPALSYMTINAFMAADGLIIPTPPNALDYASSTQFWGLFKEFTGSMKDRVKGLDKSFDFIHVLLSRVDSNQVSTHIVREWIQKTYEELVLPVEMPQTTVTQNAAAEFGTVYDISKYEGSLKTYQRAREAYDRLASIINSELDVLWNAADTPAESEAA